MGYKFYILWWSSYGTRLVTVSFLPVQPPFNGTITHETHSLLLFHTFVLIVLSMCLFEIAYVYSFKSSVRLFHLINEFQGSNWPYNQSNINRAIRLILTVVRSIIKYWRWYLFGPCKITHSILLNRNENVERNW